MSSLRRYRGRFRNRQCGDMEAAWTASRSGLSEFPKVGWPQHRTALDGCDWTTDAVEIRRTRTMDAAVGHQRNLVLIAWLRYVAGMKWHCSFNAFCIRIIPARAGPHVILLNRCGNWTLRLTQACLSIEDRPPSKVRIYACMTFLAPVSLTLTRWPWYTNST